MCKKSDRPPTWPQLEHAIRRNFGGMESDELDPIEEFKRRVHIRGVPALHSIPQEVRACTCIETPPHVAVLGTLLVARGKIVPRN